LSPEFLSRAYYHANTTEDRNEAAVLKANLLDALMFRTLVADDAVRHVDGRYLPVRCFDISRQSSYSSFKDTYEDALDMSDNAMHASMGSPSDRGDGDYHSDGTPNTVLNSLPSANPYLHLPGADAANLVSGMGTLDFNNSRFRRRSVSAKTLSRAWCMSQQNGVVSVDPTDLSSVSCMRTRNLMCSGLNNVIAEEGFMLMSHLSKYQARILISGTEIGCYDAVGIVDSKYTPEHQFGESPLTWAIQIYPESPDPKFSGIRNNGETSEVFSQNNVKFKVNDVIGLRVVGRRLHVLCNDEVVGVVSQEIPLRKKMFLAVRLCGHQGKCAFRLLSQELVD